MSRATGLRQGGGNLPYFLDSNVLIGYYFHAADAWGAAATEVFDDPEPNHTSTGVWAECFGREPAAIKRSDTTDIFGMLLRIGGWVKYDGNRTGVMRRPPYGPQRCWQRVPVSE